MIQTVLIVDDDVTFLELLKNYLTVHGYEVYVTTDGLKALNILEHQSIDLIITDILMPGMEGIEFISKLKKQKSQAKIIAMSGGDILDADTYLKIAQKFKVDAILEKPFIPEKLLEIMHNMSD